MRSRWYWCGASALLVPSLALGATVLERTLRHTVQGMGLLRAAEIEKIRLDTSRDVEAYSQYVVPLDENIDLLRFSARATKPGGEVVSVGKDDQDVRQVAQQGQLHSSLRYHVAKLPALPVGSVLDLGHEVETRVYFPAERVFLRGEDAVERLRVEVRSAPGLRWVLTGPIDGIAVEPTADGLTLSATSLPGIEPPEDAPAAEGRTVLHYAWGPRTAWRDVGEWYEELIRDLPRRAGVVAQKQSSVGGDTEDRWERLSRLLSYCQKNVRYVAVEVGVGGFRPAPAAETLDRQWGDCKDKSFLLLDLLAAAGIEAYPAMVLASDEDRVDPSFPTPFAFNHVIVALPLEEWMNGRNAPISDGYLFVDPTQTHGGAGWLGQATQGQHALIVRGSESALVRTPVMADHERRTLEVALRFEPTGEVAGDVTLRLTGDLAAAWDTEFDGTTPELVEGLVRDQLDDLFPGGTLSGIVWKREVADELPVVQLRAAVRLPGLIDGDAARWSLLVAAQGRMPEPRLLVERTVPVGLSPRIDRSTWTVHVPDDWCVPEDRTEEVRNGVGAFRQRIDGERGVIRIDRDLDVLRRWVEPDELDALRELSLSEHRTLRRRIRADCSGTGSR